MLNGLIPLLCVLISTMRSSFLEPSSRTGAGETLSKAERQALNRLRMRQLVLCTLAIQNACQMLSMRYSRMPGQPQYLSSTAVVVAEVVKIVASLFVLLYQNGPAAINQVWLHVFVAWKDTALVSVPALLYFIQNNLLYVATTHLDAASCQVGYQLKLLTTAFFTVMLLKRRV